jgi:hypothetical protein
MRCRLSSPPNGVGRHPSEQRLGCRGGFRRRARVIGAMRAATVIAKQRREAFTFDATRVEATQQFMPKVIAGNSLPTDTDHEQTGNVAE